MHLPLGFWVSPGAQTGQRLQGILGAAPGLLEGVSSSAQLPLVLAHLLGLVRASPCCAAWGSSGSPGCARASLEAWVMPLSCAPR